MRKLLKLFGIGIISGAGARAGSILCDFILNGGFSNWWNNFKVKTETTRQRHLQRYEDRRG